ncbi:MAG: hypothetical protein N2544_13850 [Burkholderiales bacterium]|nr:hypothetical protein [Burkholderiales bacterium]
MTPRAPALLLALALSLAGCEGPREAVTPIRDIVAAPARFEGKEVRIRGRVTGSAEIRMRGGASHRSYSVRDATGEMPVVTAGPFPPQGAEVTVRGTVELPPPTGTLAVGPRLRESGRGGR